MLREATLDDLRQQLRRAAAAGSSANGAVNAGGGGGGANNAGAPAELNELRQQVALRDAAIDALRQQLVSSRALCLSLLLFLVDALAKGRRASLDAVLAERDAALSDLRQRQVNRNPHPRRVCVVCGV